MPGSVERYKLRPFQEEAVQEALRQKGRIILGDEMGLGKTGEAFEAWRALSWEQLRRDSLSGPALLVAGNNAMYTWIRLAKHWGIPTPVRIEGSPAERAVQWLSVKTGHLPFVCCTREVLIRDVDSGKAPLNWQIIFTDEAHKHNNRKTRIFKALKKLQSPWFIECTGSPMRRGPQSLWALLNLINPKKWSSYWAFVGRYCVVVKTPFGMDIVGAKNKDMLARELGGVLVARKKTEVYADMPPKNRELIEAALTEGQMKMYRKVAEEGLLELKSIEGASSILLAPTGLIKMMRLRQLLMTPKLLDPNAEWGGGFEQLKEMLDESEDRHMCIYTAFAAALPILRDFLMLECGVEEGSIVQLRGGLKPEHLGPELERFRQTRGIALVSIQFAESFDLLPASWGVFIGPEWDPEANRQAEDRQHRGVDLQYPVNFYYLRMPETVDDVLWSALDVKTNTVNTAMMSVEKVRQSLAKSAGRVRAY